MTCGWVFRRFRRVRRMKRNSQGFFARALMLVLGAFMLLSVTAGSASAQDNDYWRREQQRREREMRREERQRERMRREQMRRNGYYGNYGYYGNNNGYYGNNGYRDNFTQTALNGY